VGRVDYTRLEDIIASSSPLEAVADAFVGSSTFMYLAKIDQGRILSLSGNRKKCSLYVLGNPLIGNQMHDVTTAIGLYIPFRLCVYEDLNGEVFITYDIPSSLVQHYKNEQLMALAYQFDQQLERLAIAVTSD
jgi:uncharacterized protein (DUF302 family)